MQIKVNQCGELLAEEGQSHRTLVATDNHLSGYVFRDSGQSGASCDLIGRDPFP